MVRGPLDDAEGQIGDKSRYLHLLFLSRPPALSPILQTVGLFQEAEEAQDPQASAK